MSADQTIIAWKNDEEAVDNASADMSGEDGKIQYSGLESDEADEVADELAQTVSHTGTLSNSRTLSIGSYEGGGAPGPGGVEENKKKTSLCSTLSSGDQPYLSLISSERSGT